MSDEMSNPNPYTVKDSNLKSSLTLEKLLEYHNYHIDDLMIQNTEIHNLLTNDGNWDMDKLEELWNVYLDDVVEKEHGEGWMVDTASHFVDINFSSDINRVWKDSDIEGVR